MKSLSLVAACVWTAGIAALWSAPAMAQVASDAAVNEVLKKLNSHHSVAGPEDTKSYKILFDAYLTLTKPPFEIGPTFNLSTIHPKMATWSVVSGWAESNSKMVDALLKCKDTRITKIGLPYGRANVSPAYVQANLFADVGSGETLRNSEFAYLRALDVIAAFSTAEVYRLMEVGQVQQGLDLAMATSFVLRQFCDRDFRSEKLHAINLMNAAMSNLREVYFLYFDKITAEQFTKIAILEIPFLRPERDRLFMPEADKVVAEALINEVFDEASGEADPDKFTLAFADIQSRTAPLTRFGAAKRWKMVAAIHGSRDASIERLNLIYDDWWRRWRIEAYDELLAVPTQFENANPIRYAAVRYSVGDIEVLFSVRNQLIAEVNGAAVAAGLCAYKKTFGNFPEQTKMSYTQFTRKRSDVDPFNKVLDPFRYRLLTSRHAIDTQYDTLWVEPGECILYSMGQDHTDNVAAKHTDDGVSGDLVLWPPLKVLARAQGLLE